MFSRISKCAFSRFQLGNPRLFCSLAANNKTSSPVSQVPHNLVKRRVGGLSIPWIVYSVVFTTGMSYEWIRVKEYRKELEMQDKQLKKVGKDMDELVEMAERDEKHHKELMRKLLM